MNQGSSGGFVVNQGSSGVSVDVRGEGDGVGDRGVDRDGDGVGDGVIVRGGAGVGVVVRSGGGVGDGDGVGFGVGATVGVGVSVGAGEGSAVGGLVRTPVVCADELLSLGSSIFGKASSGGDSSNKIVSPVLTIAPLVTS